MNRSVDSENITFRVGTESDLPSCKKLAIETWSLYEKELSEEAWLELIQNLKDEVLYQNLFRQAVCFVAEYSNQIIGMAFWVPKGNPTEIYDESWSYIRFVTVHTDYFGNGIGSKLTKLCIEQAQKNDESYIALHTSEMMQTAIKIYEKLGFTLLKEIDKRLGKRYFLYLKEL